MNNNPGGRVLLERQRIDDDGARYRATLTFGSDEWSGTLRVNVQDRFSVEADAFDEAPVWLVDSARAFLQTVARTAVRDPEVGWPRRVNRWRPAK